MIATIAYFNMAQLLVRKVDELIVSKLRARAAHDGVSMEEEHRRILKQALLNPRQSRKLGFLEFLKTMPEVEDSFFERPQSSFRKIDL
ncbi:MAG: DNA-binding protein [Verrucomicrobiae bacterium]|nr:DNA-binding protein [Verrucomicrobiae bacterium]